MRLVSASIHVKMVELANKGVVSTRLGSVLRIQIHPFVLQRLVLCQVVEVVSSFAGVASEEEDAILEGKAVGA